MPLTLSPPFTGTTGQTYPKQAPLTHPPLFASNAIAARETLTSDSAIFSKTHQQLHFGAGGDETTPPQKKRGRPRKERPPEDASEPKGSTHKRIHIKTDPVSLSRMAPASALGGRAHEFLIKVRVVGTGFKKGFTNDIGRLVTETVNMLNEENPFLSKIDIAQATAVYMTALDIITGKRAAYTSQDQDRGGIQYQYGSTGWDQWKSTNFEEPSGSYGGVIREPDSSSNPESDTQQEEEEDPGYTESVKEPGHQPHSIYLDWWRRHGQR